MPKITNKTIQVALASLNAMCAAGIANAGLLSLDAGQKGDLQYFLLMVSAGLVVAVVSGKGESSVP